MPLREGAWREPQQPMEQAHAGGANPAMLPCSQAHGPINSILCHISEIHSCVLLKQDARCGAHVSTVADSVQCCKVSPPCRSDLPKDATAVRMLEHGRYEVTALMPDVPTKRNPVRHMPTKLLAVSSRKRYCLVTGPRYCQSPLCLERLLHLPGQSHPPPDHSDSMRASLHTN
jgi:hypothetical protein